MKQHKFHHTSGFTLIELAIVIVIMAILMHTMMPTYDRFIKRARYTEITQGLLPTKLAIESCYQWTGNLTDCTPGANGIPTQPSFSSHSLIDNIEILPGGIIHTWPKTLHGLKTTDDYKLTPHIDHNTLSWQATGGAIRAGYTT